jgi:hypothetical protein
LKCLSSNMMDVCVLPFSSSNLLFIFFSSSLNERVIIIALASSSPCEKSRVNENCGKQPSAVHSHKPHLLR